MSDIPPNNQPTPNPIDPANYCDNCGQPFGKLESPLIWGRHNVCATCHQKLTYEKHNEMIYPTGTNVSTIFLIIGVLVTLPCVLTDFNRYDINTALVFAVLGSSCLLFGIICKAVVQGIREVNRK